LPDFALAFHAANRVIVTEVYTARNSIFDWNVSGKDLASAIVGPPAMFIPTLVLLLLLVAFLEVSQQSWNLRPLLNADNWTSILADVYLCIEIVMFYSLLWYHPKQSLSDFLFGQYLALMHYIHTFCLWVVAASLQKL
jgi:hypothetical protein